MTLEDAPGLDNSAIHLGNENLLIIFLMVVIEPFRQLLNHREGNDDQHENEDRSNNSDSHDFFSHATVAPHFRSGQREAQGR